MKKKRPKPPLTIKGVKARGYSKSYEQRLIRAIRKARKEGKKPSRQAARGHKPKEHIIRKEKEKARFGITSSQRDSIVSFLNRFNSPSYKDVPDYDELVDYVKNNGYESFTKYRKTWDSYRQRYLQGQRAGTLVRKGRHYVLGYGAEEVLHDSGLGEPADISWLYYH